jgi:hypothetical protein
MMRVHVTPVLAIILVCSGSCLGLLDSAPGLLSGEWHGVDDEGQRVDWLITLSLTESDAAWVTGSGTVRHGIDTVAVTISGPHAHPDVRLEFALADGSTFGVFTGQVLYRNHLPGYFSSRGNLILVRTAYPGMTWEAAP